MDNAQKILATIIIYFYENNEQALANLLLQSRMVDIYKYSSNTEPFKRKVEIYGPQKFIDFVNTDSKVNLKKIARAINTAYLSLQMHAGDLPFLLYGSEYLEQDSDAFFNFNSLNVLYGLIEASYLKETRVYIQQYIHQIPVNLSIHIKTQNREIGLNPISIYPLGSFQRDPNLCFTIMPFSPAFQPIYDEAIKPAVAIHGMNSRRGDDITSAGDVLRQIGLAHIIGHQVILLTQDISSVPFDLRQQRHIIYNSSSSGLQKLIIDLSSAIRSTIVSQQ